MPAAVETVRAGSWLTRPSPIVKTVYLLAAAESDMWCCKTPITIPPMIFIAVIRRPAIASPLTNLLAPSMAP